MNAIPLIRASIALHVAAFLRDVGAPSERLWSEAGLPLGVAIEPERLVPLHSVLRFCEDAARTQGAVDVGLRVARRSGLAAIGQFGRAVTSAPTLLDAMHLARDRVAAHNSGARYWIVPSGDAVRFCRRFRTGDTAFRQSDLLTVGLMTDLVRMAAGPGWLPERIELQSTDAAGVAPLATLDGVASRSVQEGCHATSILVPRSLLHRTLGGEAVRRAGGGRDWLDHAPPTDFERSLDLVVESILESKHGHLAAAARASGSTVRSFQRRLARAGLTYSEVLDRVRLRRATQLLEDGEAKVVEVAFALGYSDPAHFTRAFRRWTATTPNEYRQLVRAELPRSA